MPKVFLVNDWLEREELLELQDEIWEQLRENYFDKKSIWSDDTAAYQETTKMGVVHLQSLSYLILNKCDVFHGSYTYGGVEAAHVDLSKINNNTLYYDIKYMSQ